MNQYLAIYQVRQMLQKLISETADADLADKLKNIDHQLNYFLDKGIDFKQVVDGIDDSIFITDNKGNVLYVNPAYTRNTGIESERVINHNIYDLIEKDKLYSGGAIPDVLSTGKLLQYCLSEVWTVLYCCTNAGTDSCGYCKSDPVHPYP